VSDEGQSFWERLSRVPAGSLKGQVLFIAVLMALATIFNVVWAVITLSWVPIMAAGVGWIFVLWYAAMRFAVFDRTAGRVGKILVPSGGSTPSVNQHSNIEAMVARGRYAEAAEAYRQALAADPADLVACDQLGRLALQDLKDYELAVYAYREGEKRARDPRRRAGYALLAVGIYRDNLGDPGRAIVELSRLLNRYPDLPNASELKDELARLKGAHLEQQ
jgi:tetratricopeptide (TPR) repeat protein